jgi:excinuclease ABC subunit B
VIYVSATPADYEIAQVGGEVVEQIVRPTGLVDPAIEVHSAVNQVDDLLEEIRICCSKGYRTLVTTLTKRMAEDLTDYYTELGLKVRYLHSDITTLERMDILRDLRLGIFDVLIGINLLREGLDIPEVALVAILDADKEGFLRSARSLIQTFGRAARNLDGRVILYADRQTPSMQQAITETNRRRLIQDTHNRAHGITPESIKKEIAPVFTFADESAETATATDRVAETVEFYENLDDIDKAIREMEKEMKAAAKALEFERAAEMRDRIRALQKLAVFEG